MPSSSRRSACLLAALGLSLCFGGCESLVGLAVLPAGLRGRAGGVRSRGGCRGGGVRFGGVTALALRGDAGAGPEGLRGGALKEEGARGGAEAVLGMEARVARLEDELAAAKRELRMAKLAAVPATFPPPPTAAEAAREHDANGGGRQGVEAALGEIEGLIHVVDALTGSPMDGGCPWTWTQEALDVIQHAQSELREVQEELMNPEGKRFALLSELGDLLFNTLLLVKVCERDGIGGVSLSGCAAFASAKVKRRAPFVFEDGRIVPLSAEEASALWKAIKVQEKAGLVRDCPPGYEYDAETDACVADPGVESWVLINPNEPTWMHEIFEGGDSR